MLFRAKHVAFYPGCFDPVHRQHIFILQHILKQYPFIEEVFILINQDSEEKKLIASFQRRLEMFKEVLPKDVRLKIYPSPIGFYTTNVIKKFRRDNPSTTFYLVLGSDQINQLPAWKKTETLPDLVTFVCAPRLNFLPKPLILKRYQILNMDNLKINAINSTQLRNGQDWKNLYPKTIEYIIQHRLYFAEILQRQVKDKDRIMHCQRVASLAMELNEYFQLDAEANFLYIGALLHDITKKWNQKQHLSLLKKHKVSTKIIKTWPLAIWHAYTGALFIKKELNISHLELLEAVKYHSTANSSFVLMGQIVFIADKLEPLKKDPEFQSVYDFWKKIKNDNNDFYSSKRKLLFDKLFRLTLKALKNKLIKQKHSLTPFIQAACKEYLR